MEAEKGTQLEKTTKRVRLTVAYDGTNYHGWQIQNNGITIESELNRCLTDLLREPVEVIGASRTDSGVHALGNIAVFDTTSRMPAEKISYALNQRLPEDIRIQKSEQVPDDWHPRRCDSRKTYEYRIYRAQFPMPVKRLYSLFTYYELDVNRMQEAAAYLEGEHDFKSFCQTGAQVESTVRTIYSVEVEEQGENDLVIRVCGNGFLYNMVRIIAGTLLDIGQGKRDPMDIFTDPRGKRPQHSGAYGTGPWADSDEIRVSVIVQPAPFAKSRYDAFRYYVTIFAHIPAPGS